MTQTKKEKQLNFCGTNLFHLSLFSLFLNLYIYNFYKRTNAFGIQKKNNFEFHFNLWKTKKNQKIYQQMSYKAIAKDPSNYEEREIEKKTKD